MATRRAGGMRLTRWVHATAIRAACPTNLLARADYARAHSAQGDARLPCSQTSPTTFNARTYLQPQLQKAAKSDEKVTKGDKNPKDFILFPKGGFDVVTASKV